MSRVGHAVRMLPRRALAAPIQVYRRFLSPLKPQPTCRFHPTCSHYAHEALLTHGALRGSWLAVVRVAKCHPFHPGGFDPVPPPPDASGASGDPSPAAPTSSLTPLREES